MKRCRRLLDLSDDIDPGIRVRFRPQTSLGNIQLPAGQRFIGA
jgi:hypothetical protein